MGKEVGTGDKTLREGKRRLVDLADYVAHLAKLAERPINELRSYGTTVFHEAEFRGRLGVHHDQADDDGAVWLSIERLARIDPPAPGEVVTPWVTVGRDPHREPVVAAMRKVTLTKGAAESLVQSGEALLDDVLPAVKPLPTLSLDECRDAILHLDRLSDERAAVQRYVDGPWRSWAEKEKPRRETIALYERLFALMQLFQSDGVERPLQLVWGIGLARWKTEAAEVDHPLLEQLVEVELDERSSLLVRPRTTRPNLHLAPFEQLDGAAMVRREAQKFLDAPATDPLSPFERTSFEPVLRLAVQLLDPCARYWPDQAVDPSDRIPPSADSLLTVTDGWVVYARPRGENVFAQDLDRLKAAIREGIDLPAPAARFVEEPSNLPKAGALGLRGGMLGWSTASTYGAGSQTGGGSQEAAEAFFFPKPFNQEQQEIVRRLEGADGLVVQGPPGTGKTHTIANIICHYLATGRRVLVTSKGEGALGVLRDQLPDGIRDLAIALLTSEREGMRQLERAVSVIANSLTQMDGGRLARAIRDNEARTAQLQSKLAAIDQELAAAAEKHLRPVELVPGRSLLPAELARSLVADRELHAWLPDRPGSGAAFEPALDDGALAAARDARRRLGPDLAHVAAVLPASADLPDTVQLLAVHNDLTTAARIEADARAGGLPHLSIREERAVERADALAGRLKRFLDVLGTVENTPWARDLARRLRPGSPMAERHLLEQKCAVLEKLLERQVGLLSAPAEVPENAELSGVLVAAVERAANGQRPFGTFGGLFDKATALAQAQLSAIRVDGRAPDGPTAWKRVAAEVEFRRDLRGLLASWPALSSLGLPPLDDRLKVALPAIGSLARSLRAVLDVPIERAILEREFTALFPAGAGPGEPLATPGGVRELITRIRTVVAKHRLAARREARDAVLATLARGSGAPVEALARLVREELGNPDVSVATLADSYERSLAEFTRLRRLTEDFSAVREATARLSAMGAPKWAEALATEPVSGEHDPWTAGGWRESWDWWRRDAYLREIDGRERILSLSEERLRLEDELRRVFQEIVRDRTYLGLKEQVSDRVLGKLHEFMVAIKKIGKGAGKGAGLWRDAARNAMTDASAAVPCWIMPHWRVAESLPPRLGDFDLVVIDEASQSDLSALPAILRGKKLLIVGDDKQVSPTAAFVEVRQLMHLRDSFLADQFFGALMLPGNSLYDLTGAVFPGNKIMLREHFRCVEPIIRFSMQFYNAPGGGDPLYPVRIPKASERLDPPLVAIHVPHGRKTRSQTNPAEAEVIVEEIARVVEDPAFRGRSIGIVSLIGGKQAELIQSMLLERVGEGPFIRHQIACGDSATFQGKERDVMFVSMVECPATSTSKTATMFEQRFNVALSRARDRMVLVHSVTEDMLKPGDLKAKVLRHFRDPLGGKAKLAADVFDQCDSDFEREVLRRLFAKDYRAVPQVRVGPYAIDIVVEGAEDRRLAVELDGDRWHGPDRWQEDLARQRVLERCGWRFWRCWGSSFALDPDACMADLERTLARLGIEPQGATWQPPIYTEFRTASPPALAEAEEAAPAMPDAASAEVVTPPAREFAAESATAPAVASVAEAPRGEAGEVVQIGDRFVVVYTDEPTRQLTLTMTAGDHRPDVGLVAADHVIWRRFLGAAVDDQVEVEIDKRSREAVVLAVDKALPVRRAA